MRLCKHGKRALLPKSWIIYNSKMTLQNFPHLKTKHFGEWFPVQLVLHATTSALQVLATFYKLKQNIGPSGNECSGRSCLVFLYILTNTTHVAMSRYVKHWTRALKKDMDSSLNKTCAQKRKIKRTPQYCYYGKSSNPDHSMQSPAR